MKPYSLEKYVCAIKDTATVPLTTEAVNERLYIVTKCFEHKSNSLSADKILLQLSIYFH